MTFLPEFIPSKPFTIGVEAEFQIIDSQTRNLAQKAPEILAQVPETLTTKIKQEFICSMVEVATGVCDSMDQVKEDLSSTLKILHSIADNEDCLIFASSLHPFARYQDQVLSKGKRYTALMHELQIAGRRLISQGLHVHIGIPEKETVIKVCDAIRPYLPLLLALTGSSPYYSGEDTGFSSYRSRLLDALTRAGLPYTFRNWHSFKALITDLHKAGLINDVRDIWWDVRPHPDLGTVEIRICDLPVTFSELLTITALVQALVKTLAEAEQKTKFPRLEIIANNKWQAARHGLHGRFIDIDNMSEPLLMKEAVNNMIQSCLPAARLLGTENYLMDIESTLSHGTGSDKIRATLTKGHNFTSCIDQLYKVFWT